MTRESHTTGDRVHHHLHGGKKGRRVGEWGGEEGGRVGRGGGWENGEGEEGGDSDTHIHVL